MNQPSLQKIIELVDFDQAIIQLEHQIDKLQRELEESRKEANLCREGLERFLEHKRTLKKEVDKKEFEMKTLDSEEKEKRSRLDGATNQREYNSFLKEIEELKKRQHELEEDLLATWKKYEQAEAELKDRKLFCDEKLTSLDTVITQKMQQIHQLSEQLEKQRNMRKQKLEGIPEELIEKYTAMYKQVSNPIVPIEKGSCSACFYPLTQKDLHNARNGKLLQCKDCFRFLFLKEAHEKVSGE